MKNCKNIFFILSAFLVSTLLSPLLHADPLEVIDVKRNIPLAESEPVYKDYYIKINGSSGLKRNMVVKAMRKIPIRDFTMKAIGDFSTTVGLLKILQVSETIAVAREFKLITRDEEAMLEQIGIMVGDTLDLSDSFNDTSKPPSKKASVIVPVPVENPVEIPLEKTAAAETKEEI